MPYTEENRERIRELLRTVYKYVDEALYETKDPAHNNQEKLGRILDDAHDKLKEAKNWVWEK